MPQAGGEGEAGLTAADDQHIRLLRDPQGLPLRLAPLGPRLPPRMDTVLGAGRPPFTHPLFMALELIEGGEQGPGAAVLQPHVAAAVAHPRLEAEPGLDAPAALDGLAAQREGVRGHIRQAGRQHRRDRLGPLLGAQVPGEGHQIAPEALRVEQAHHGMGITAREGCGKRLQPRFGCGGGGGGQRHRQRGSGAAQA